MDNLFKLKAVEKSEFFNEIKRLVRVESGEYRKGHAWYGKLSSVSMEDWFDALPSKNRAV